MVDALHLDRIDLVSPFGNGNDGGQTDLCIHGVTSLFRRSASTIVAESFENASSLTKPVRYNSCPNTPRETMKTDNAPNRMLSPTKMTLGLPVTPPFQTQPKRQTINLSNPADRKSTRLPSRPH